MFPKATIMLTDSEIERYKNGEEVYKIVFDAACRSSYHPYGYGIYGFERIYEEEGKHYAEWQRGTHCD